MHKYPIVYRGMNAAKIFMEVAIKEAEEIEYLYSNKKSMIPLTKEQQDVYDSSSHCYICSGSFTKEDWSIFSQQQMLVSEASMANAKTSQFDISPSHLHHRPCSNDRFHGVQFAIQLLTP
ncbi:hypothetical protein TNCV_2574681 [Trichonephila clavipes]|nr:hypothetical protein TNCV_2574681 [Trichonephila clavipes]